MRERHSTTGRRRAARLDAGQVELVLRQRGERVGHLPGVLAGREVGVGEQPAGDARHGPGARPAAEDAALALEARHLRPLEAADARPVGHLVGLEPVQQHVQIEPGDVVADEHVRVDLVQPREKEAQEALLVGLPGEHDAAGELRDGVFRVLLLEKGVPTRRVGHAVEAADDGEVAQLMGVVPLVARHRRVDVHRAGHHHAAAGDLVRVRLVVQDRHEMNRRHHRRRRLSQRLALGHRRLPDRLVAGELHLNLAPAPLLLRRHRHRPLQGEPRRAHHLPLEHEELGARRLRPEQRAEVRPAEVARQRRLRSRVLHLEHVLLRPRHVLPLEGVAALHRPHRELCHAAGHERLPDLELERARALLEQAHELELRLGLAAGHALLEGRDLAVRVREQRLRAERAHVPSWFSFSTADLEEEDTRCGALPGGPGGAATEVAQKGHGRELAGRACVRRVGKWVGGCTRGTSG